MGASATPPAGESRARLALGTLITHKLRVMLEQRAARLAAVLGLLGMASLFAYFPPTGDQVIAEWMFILPVAVAAIAAGLREGLLTALLAAVLSGFFAAYKDGQFETELLLTILSARFALYGITAAVLGAFAEAHYSVQDQLRQLATLDPLTKVSNIERFHHETRMLHEAGTPYVVMLTDLDELKSINDRYGHQAGSSAIQLMANVLRRVVRTTDLVARFGGDEFVVILREADRVGAQIVANRVRSMLAEERMPAAPNEVLTTSIGVALAGEDGATTEELLTAADRAMYEDKRARKAAR